MNYEVRYSENSVSFRFSAETKVEFYNEEFKSGFETELKRIIDELKLLFPKDENKEGSECYV